MKQPKAGHWQSTHAAVSIMGGGREKGRVNSKWEAWCKESEGYWAASACSLTPFEATVEGLLGDSTKRCSRSRGMVPYITAGSSGRLKRRSKAWFSFHRKARERVVEKYCCKICSKYEELRNFVQPGISHWTVPLLQRFYLMPDWLFSWFLLIKSLPGCPEEKLCLQHPSF